LSRTLTWVLAAVAGVVVVLIVTAMIGNRDESDETVSAGEWAQTVCGAVGVWRGQLEAIVEDVRTPNPVAGSEEPQSETPQGRTGLIRVGLERAVQATETMVVAVDNAGIPDTAQGEEAADQVSNWADDALDDLEEAQDSLDDEADSLEDAIDQIGDALRAIGSVLVTGKVTIADVARLHPELADAMRDSRTCNELQEETAR
jgi:hypothetical protein